MKSVKHGLVSLSVTWRISADKSEKSTTGEFTLSSICQCGVVAERSWTFEPCSSGELEQLGLGLIARATAAFGRAAQVRLSRGSASDLSMN